MLLSIKKILKPIVFGVVFLYCLSILANANIVLADSEGYTPNSGSANSTTWGEQAENIQSRTGLGNDDPRYIIANIINIALGFLGIIAIIIIMYAGFLWMTSGGNSDKINQAKKMLVGGVIGLIIILSSFAIAAFIMDAIYRATTDANLNGSGGNTYPNTGPGGGGGGGVGGGGDMNLPCSSTEGTCDPDQSICDALGSMWSCNDNCVCVADNLGTCFNAEDDICNYPCSGGLSCLGAGGCNNNHAIGGCGAGDTSCMCCCNPLDDQCGLLYPTLSCKADSGSCSGAERGMCCGCQADSECGAVASVGCGSDTCCNQRPTILGVVPNDLSNDVCTNALISVEFDQAMKSSGLSDNFLVVGDYGVSACPNGTRLVNPADLGVSLPTGANNYCAVDGGFTLRNIAGQHFVDFALNSFLKINTRYYVIIKGDTNLSNNIDEGIVNYWGISKNGSSMTSFTTINDTSGAGGACVIEKIELTPPAYLINNSADSIREHDQDAGDPTFDTERDHDKLFEAKVYSRNNQEIVAMNGYNWNWNIVSTVSSVVGLEGSATISNLSAGSRLAYAMNGVTDGRSQIIATIDMSPYAGTNASMLGNGFNDIADVSVFICNNPWPPIPNTGIWEPWRPTPNNPYNYSIYYCRDKAGLGTVDDLPSFDSSGINSAPNSDPVMEQVYFTYQNPPAPGSIINAYSAPANPAFPDGGTVYLEWSGASPGYAPIKESELSVTGYKVYWGESSKDYSNSLDVKAVTSANISGLNNNQPYYFSVTAYTGDKVESSFYNEMIATPVDEVSPTSTPVFLPNDIKVRANEIVLRWSEVESAEAYQFAYGLQAGLYGIVENVDKDDGITITNLSPGTQYYFGIGSLDAAGNASAYSTYSTTTLAQ